MADEGVETAGEADVVAQSRKRAIKKTGSKSAARKGARKSAKKTAGRKTAGTRPSAAASEVLKSELPYVLVTGRIPDLFAKLQSAGVPQRFSHQFLRHLGFVSSNDRAFSNLLRKLGFTDATGVPTERYRRFRNPAESGQVLADAIRDLYADLYAVNENLHERDVGAVSGVVSRVTGIDNRRAGLVARTFKALAELADFDALPDERDVPTRVSLPPEPSSPERVAPVTERQAAPPLSVHAPSTIGFRYNIEIHLPATTDIAVYNAIFRSLREHLVE